MKKSMLYELVNANIRDEFDLTQVAEIIFKSIAFTYPEASNVGVFSSFYCFDLPQLSVEEKNSRARRLGRLLASKMPALAELAMRTYESAGCAKSNQLFREIKGKKRMRYCLDALRDAPINLPHGRDKPKFSRHSSLFAENGQTYRVLRAFFDLSTVLNA